MGECNNDNYNNNNNGFGEIEDGGSELGFHVCLWLLNTVSSKGGKRGKLDMKLSTSGLGQQGHEGNPFTLFFFPF